MKLEHWDTLTKVHPYQKNIQFHHYCYFCGKNFLDLIDTEESDLDGNEIKICQICVEEAYHIFHK
jgi:Pyruvate/2-oxoacid:ferredoxin oxidoreductase delta subunit